MQNIIFVYNEEIIWTRYTYVHIIRDYSGPCYCGKSISFKRLAQIAAAALETDDTTHTVAAVFVKCNKGPIVTETKICATNTILLTKAISVPRPRTFPLNRSCKQKYL